MEVEVINLSKVNSLPSYASIGDAGMDIKADIMSRVNTKFLKKSTYRAWIDEETGKENYEITIFPGGRALIPSGIKVGIPKGYEIQVRARSGLALKNGITVLNGIGTIDEGYKDEIGIILINTSDEPFVIHQGDRIAQIVLKKFETIEWKEVSSLGGSNRGGGLGHSGI